MDKQRCGKIISEFVERYGCKKKALCEHCKCSYSTFSRMMKGSERVRDELYIEALTFIGEKFINELRLRSV